MLAKFLKRVLADRNGIQDELEVVLSVLSSKLIKKYGWTREVTARFLEHQLYVSVLRFQSGIDMERSRIEFEKALETVRIESQLKAVKTVRKRKAA